MGPKATLRALWAFLLPLCVSAISCNQLSNPYDGPYNKQFEVNCNSYSTGGDQIGPSFEVVDLETCIQLCADITGCKAALFDRSQYLCYLLDAWDGPTPNNLYDMALLLSSAPTTTFSPTTSDAPATTSDVPVTTSDVQAPPSCNQLDNPSYIDDVKFTIFCGNQATGGNAVDYSNQLQSLTECMEFCADTLACRAVTFDNSFNECYLYDGFNGFMSDFSKDMAVVASRPSVSSTTEDSTTASLSASSETSTTIEYTSESTESTPYTSSSASLSPETTSLSSSSALTSETTSAGTIESSSFSTTSSVTSEATVSLLATSSLFTSLSSSQDIPPGTTSDSALESTMESTFTSAALATTSLEAISSSTDSSSLSSESILESTSDTQLASTVVEESASLESTTVATSINSIHTDTTNIQMSTDETLTTETPSMVTSTVETSDITTSTTVIKSTSTGSSGPSHTIQTESPYSVSSSTTRDFGSKTLSISYSTTTETHSETRLPTSLPTPTAIYTAYSILTIDHAYTRTQLAGTVTTVTYTTVNPSNPASLITTCVPITMLYSLCGCKHQVYPTVDMTTVACTQGGDIVTLTVPKAAYETGREDYTHPIIQYPSGWIGEHQTHTGSNIHPTGRPTGGSQAGSENGKPEYPTVATGSQGSHPSYKAHQPATPTSAVGSNGDDQSEQGNPQPSVTAQSSAESINNTPMNPSQPSSSKSLITETRIIPTSQHGTSALPSELSRLDHGQAPSESKGAPSDTPVAVSEAHRYDLTSWIMIATIAGMLLL